MNDFSPTAQEILNQFVMGACGKTYDIHAGLAAALRAAADQVVPEEPEPDQSAMTFSDWNLKTESWDARMATRSELLAIAAELEGKNCPGCEGTPAAENSPCAVCGRLAIKPLPLNTDD